MRFLFLGTGAADWKRPQDTGEYRRNTSTLVDGEMLIDGNETISEALPMLENVPAMLFTHSHGDHYSKPFLQRVRPRRVFCEESWAEEAGAPGDSRKRVFNGGLPDSSRNGEPFHRAEKRTAAPLYP